MTISVLGKELTTMRKRKNDGITCAENEKIKWWWKKNSGGSERSQSDSTDVRTRVRKIQKRKKQRRANDIVNKTLENEKINIG